MPTVLAIVVYRSIVGLWFWTDDFLWLRAATNPSLFDNVKESFTFPRGATPYWRPLVDLYFFGMYRTVGLNATAFHIGTLVLHTASAAVLGLLAFRITRSRITATLAAAMFVISPTYSTMVPWASGVTATLSGFFSIITVYLFVQWLQDGRSYRWLILPAATLAAALLSKEEAIALPGVLVVAALVLKPPGRSPDIRAIGLALAPFAAIGIIYALPQLLNVVGSAETPRLSIGWHAAPNLIDMMNWISLPWPLSYADWVSPARWAAFGVFTSAAALAAIRRQWLLPALYATSVLMLIPSSFFTGSFEPRWTYHASLSWALFIAVLITHGYEWLSARHRIVGASAFGVASFALLVLLAGRSVDSQVWVPGVANEFRQVQRALASDCEALSPGSNLYVFPLPELGPAYLIQPLTMMYHPEAAFNAVFPSTLAKLPAPQPEDCALSWNPRTGYTATAVDLSRTGLAFWTPPGAPNLLGAAYDVTPFNSILDETDDEVRVSSDESPFGLVIGETAPVGSQTYLTSIWVKAVDGQESRVSLNLAQATANGPVFSTAEFRLSQEWQQIAVYHRGREADPGTLVLSVVATPEEPLEHSFLVKDPEIKLFTVQTPLQ